MSYQPHQSEDMTLKPVATDRAAAPVSERNDLFLIEAVLKGYPRSMAQVDALAAVRRLLADRASAPQAVRRPLTRQAAIEAITDKLTQIEAAGCTCLTKTPEIKYHAPNCKYRLAVEVEEMLEDALGIVPPAPQEKT